MVTELKRMQQRRDTTANWTASNPILLPGELGYDTDENMFKVGDGASTWGTLPYVDFSDAAALVAAQLADTGTPIGAAAVTAINARIKARASVVNVKDYGAVGDGVTDDTAAILAAWNVRQAVYFPEGNYLYNGPGLFRPSDGSFVLIGDGARRSKITLGAGVYLIKDSIRFFTESYTSGLWIEGGAGFISLTRGGIQVAGFQLIEDCLFQNFTKTAIGHTASDFPYWKISRCQFYGADYVSTIAIALPGLTDSVTIEDCEFLRVRVGVKLGSGGNNAHITRSAFLHFGGAAPSPRISIWIVPQTNAVNAGPGFTLTECKFGTENNLAGDKRIVYADNDPATGTIWPEQHAALATASTGHIYGHNLYGNYFTFGITGSALITSMTPNVADLHIGPNVFSGGAPAMLLEFLNPASVLPDRLTVGSVFGPFTGSGMVGREFTPTPKISNVPGVGNVLDPLDAHNVNVESPNSHEGGADVTRYAKLLTTTLSAFTISAGAGVRTNVTDAVGGTDGHQFDLNGVTGLFIYATMDAAAIRLGEPVWLEFDAMAGDGAGGVLPAFNFLLQTSGNGPYHFRRAVVTPDRWTRYRFLHPGLRVTAGVLFAFQSIAPAVAGSIRFGRARAYHAREPLPERLMLAHAPTQTTAPAAGAAAALPATPAGYMDVSLNGTLRKIAYY